MTDYKIIKVGDDFYIAHEDFRREAWRTDVKLGVASYGNQKSVVEREGFFIEPYAEVGDIKFRFGPTLNDNYVNIGGAGDIRITWPQAEHMMSSLREKEDRDKRTAFEEGRKNRLGNAAKTGEIQEADGAVVYSLKDNDGV